MESFEDLRQTQEWANYLSSIGWTIERIKNQELGITNYLYIRKIPLLPWSIGKLQRAKNVDEEKLKNAKRKHKILKIIRKETVARRTIWINVRKSKKSLLAQMKAKARYNIGLAQKRGVKIKIVDGEKLKQSPLLKRKFLQLLRENSKRVGIFSLPEKWYRKQINSFGEKCFVALAYFENNLVSGNFFMCSPTSCFYSHNGSTVVGRKNMAPSLCVWEGILEAKRRKLKNFDFDGVWDGSFALKRWRGFSRFKNGFGGKEVNFS